MHSVLRRLSRHATGLFLTAALLPATLNAAPAELPLTVRVDSADGAPRWLVNGQPRRARVFWGAPGPTPLKISPAARDVSFEFLALGSSTNVTLHFRFGQTPGEVFLDDVQVTDVESGQVVLPKCDFEGGEASFAREWISWPPGAANTVATLAISGATGKAGSAALKVSLKAPAKGEWPDFHLFHQANLKLVEGRRYRVDLWTRATPERSLTVAFYQPGEPFIFLGGPEDCYGQQIRLAARAGVDFVSFPIDLPWPAPGRAPDWHAADMACKLVLNANPQALLIPRIPMDPPDWWRQAHPDDVMRWENGRRDKAAPASVRYRQDVSRQVTALIEHLEARFGDHIAGYHPCGQNTGEWFYESTWDSPLSGYAPVELDAWHAWLKQHYADDAALRQASGRHQDTRDAVPLPTPQERHASPAGVFRDGVKERRLVDFAEFQQATMADCVCDLAHAIRTASHGRKLVFFFYGYGFEFGAVPNGPAVSGHYALRRVLDCPDVDVLCSPISYFDRGPGGGAPAMSAAESVALAGKLWLCEDDTHTFLATGDQPGSADHVTTLEASNGELLRNLGQEACRNFGTWWMDLGSTGWFNDARLWAEMARMKAVDEVLLAHPAPYHPEVAAVLDERAMKWLTPEGSRVSNAAIYEARAALGRMGTPYGQYLMDDVLAGRVNARMFVFLNAWSLTQAERIQLAKVTSGKTCVWSYAPGYLNGIGACRAWLPAFTGFWMQPAPATTGRAKATEAGLRAGLPGEFGLAETVRPLFSPVATNQEILAVYADGTPAVARVPHQGGVSYLCGPPGLSSGLLRAAAADAGVHLFTHTDCNVYANGPFLVLHGARDGIVEVNTARPNPVSPGNAGVHPREVVDALTSETVGVGPRFPLALRRDETRVLKY